MFKIVLIRHGESEWNESNKFTGWYDSKLTKNGKKEAKKAGKLLKKNNMFFDSFHTSVLKRAIYTLWIILKKINQPWVKIKKTWRLNERHYGKLQGLNKEKVTKTYGKKKIFDWRRSFFSIPPCIKKYNDKKSGYDLRYSKIKKQNFPLGESLELTLKRVVFYWKNIIIPELKKKKKIIIVAHGNSLRALITYLDKIKVEDVPNLNIPTGRPIIYQFDNNLKPKKYYFL